MESASTSYCHATGTRRCLSCHSRQVPISAGMELVAQHQAFVFSFVIFKKRPLHSFHHFGFLNMHSRSGLHLAFIKAVPPNLIKLSWNFTIGNQEQTNNYKVLNQSDIFLVTIRLCLLIIMNLISWQELTIIIIIIKKTS